MLDLTLFASGADADRQRLAPGIHLFGNQLPATFLFILGELTPISKMSQGHTRPSRERDAVESQDRWAKEETFAMLVFISLLS